MVNGRRQTGHLGWRASSVRVALQSKHTNILFIYGEQILLDAFAIENVAALGLDGILRHVVTKSAYSGFDGVGTQEILRILRAPQD
jgi:hypothetical protein